jgi:hypothetical protein
MTALRTCFVPNHTLSGQNDGSPHLFCPESHSFGTVWWVFSKKNNLNALKMNLPHLTKYFAQLTQKSKKRTTTQTWLSSPNPYAFANIRSSASLALLAISSLTLIRLWSRSVSNSSKHHARCGKSMRFIVRHGHICGFNEMICLSG